MSEDVSPTLRLWQLAEVLRTHRLAAGLTLEQAAQQAKSHSGRWSKSKVNRIEIRNYTPQPAEVEQLATVYGLDAAESARLAVMAKEARRKGWWQSTPMVEELQTFVGLEQAATQIRQFDLALVPGLLQTSEYARVLAASIEPSIAVEQTETLIAGRMIRQQAVTRAEPVELHIVLSEAALRCPVGGRRVWRNQLERLLDVREQSNVTFQVLPFAAGAHPGLANSFSLLTLPGLATDIGYIECVGGDLFLEDRDDVRKCTMRFGTLSAMALSPSESLELVGAILAEFQ